MGLNFRRPGDMGRYVADNDPGGIAAGFSNLENFLAAGNKLPELARPGGTFSQLKPPEEGIMQLTGGNTGTISQITQPIQNPNGIQPIQNPTTNSVDDLNKFVNNMINNRLKEFFGGIMGMLDV